MSVLHRSFADRRRRASKKLFHISKQVYHLSGLANSRYKTLVFVVGCQRSGTTLIERVLGQDWRAKSYSEFSELTSQDTENQIRLNPLPMVKEVVSKDKASIIIIKPLVESQNIVTWLDYFPGSKALWMYRDYRDVIASSIKKFGPRNGICDLWPIVENNRQNWRAEHVSESVKALVLKHFCEEMNPYDAAALFWFARNSLYFDLNLYGRSDVMLCKYEDLVTNPLTVVGRIYAFLEHPFPANRTTSTIHASSVGKGKDIALSPQVEQPCSELWQKLEAVYQLRVGRHSSEQKELGQGREQNSGNGIV